MKCLVYGRNKDSVKAMQKTLKRLGFNETKTNPHFILSLGGDGTFLYAERLFPGIPKLLIRDSNICNKCENLEFDELFMKIQLKQFTIMKYYKLEAVFKGKKYLAINDVVVRNMVPLYAIRFELDINGKKSSYIGDGFVASTVFGSTGYHYSITGEKFNKGIGLALNNVTVNAKHEILQDNAKIVATLTRHDAHLTIDNDPKIMTIKKGESVTIKGSKKFAKIVKVI